MSSKSKSSLSDTPNSKASPATPRVVGKLNRGVAKSDTDSPSPLQNPRLSIDRSSPRPVSSKPAFDTTRSVNSKPTSVDRRSPRLTTPPDKQQTRVPKGQDLQAQLNLLEEDLIKAKEQLILVQKEKDQALDELKAAHELADEANGKLKEALVAQRRAEDDSEIEKFRALELEQFGIDFTEKKENEWQNQIDSIRNQHALDIATLIETTQDLHKANQELAMTTDAKNQALSHADDATKIAEIHAEKVEILSNEVIRLKGLLESRLETAKDNDNKTVSMLNDDIHALKQELASAKTFEDKLMEKEASIERLNVELEACKMAETYTHSLLEEWKNKADEIENSVESSNDARVSLEKSLEEKESLLQNAKSEISVLRGEVGALEITVGKQNDDLEESDCLLDKAKQESLEMEKKVESVENELEMVKEEKTKALKAEQLAADNAQILLEEKNKVIVQLETAKNEEDKSKIAMESLAAALHEVSSEARESKEKLLFHQTEKEQYEARIKELNNGLKLSNEKYETMVMDSKHEMGLFAKEIEQLKGSFNNSNAEWEQKELHFMNCIKQTDEQNSSMEKEVQRVLDLLKETENNNCALKDEGAKLHDSLAMAESEVNYMKKVLGEAKAETMKLKETLLDKENEMQAIMQENEDLQQRDVNSLKKIAELSKSLEGATLIQHTEENGDLTDSEKDYDLLPKVIKFSEENGQARDEKSNTEVPTKAILTEKTDLANGNHTVVGTYEKLKNGNVKNYTEEEEGEESKGTEKEKDLGKREFNMWESCKIDEKEYEPEESLEEQSISKTESSDSFDQINRLSSSDANNGAISPLKQAEGQQKKKKKPLLRKFGSLLKKSTSSGTQK